eukprot:Nk52_evm2s1629 gene=Nk52_evmTU2s1629
MLSSQADAKPGEGNISVGANAQTKIEFLDKKGKLVCGVFVDAHCDKSMYESIPVFIQTGKTYTKGPLTDPIAKRLHVSAIDYFPGKKTTVTWNDANRPDYAAIDILKGECVAFEGGLHPLCGCTE